MEHGFGWALPLLHTPCALQGSGGLGDCWGASFCACAGEVAVPLLVPSEHGFMPPRAMGCTLVVQRQEVLGKGASLHRDVKPTPLSQGFWVSQPL